MPYQVGDELRGTSKHQGTVRVIRVLAHGYKLRNTGAQGNGKAERFLRKGIVEHHYSLVKRAKR